MKKTNNKGFSLVELIIVIAIMAVLIGILAPQFLRYVEKSRLQKDNTALSEIANAAKIAAADEAIFKSLAATTTFTPASQVFTFGTGNLLEKELNEAVGATVTLSSSQYKTTAPSITITASGNNVSVTGSNICAAPGATPGNVTY